MIDRILTVNYTVEPSFSGRYTTREGTFQLKIREHPSRKDVAIIYLSKLDRVPLSREDAARLRMLELLSCLESARGVLLDARVLEELYRRSGLIPPSWKTGKTYFLGTRFVGVYSRYDFPYLEWRLNRWDWGTLGPELIGGSDDYACLAE